jgi:hypothetical protein
MRRLTQGPVVPISGQPESECPLVQILVAVASTLSGCVPQSASKCVLGGTGMQTTEDWSGVGFRANIH